MNAPKNDQVKSNEKYVPEDVNNSEESTKAEKGFPDIDAENFDDAGDLESLQLGLATAPKDKFLDAEKDLPSDEDEDNIEAHHG